MPSCAFCQNEVVIESVGRRDTCPSCGRDLHCCYQCRFYDASAHNQCHEPQADRVVDKEKSNFCDYFGFDPQIRIKSVSKDNAKSKLEALFRKK